ncbi:MAG: MmcQ/YjbR family DNA-binding protein [Geminicoccaceae bacterium]
MTTDPIEQLRAICLALPEATEKEPGATPTFRVRDKIFAMPKQGDGRLSVWFKAPSGSQEILVGADPDTFFRPPYVGHKELESACASTMAPTGPRSKPLSAAATATAPRRLIALLA